MDEKQEKSFAEMFDQGFQTPERFDPGQQIEARVVRIGGDSVFLDIGGKSEGYIRREEFLSKDGTVSVKEGDLINAYFLSAERSEMLFTTSLGTGPAARAHLQEAYASRIPVEGLVVKEVKGGFEIKLAGSLRAFCPFSQIDLRRVEGADDWEGKSLPFLITKYDEAGRNIVLSRRLLLENERKEQREKLREQLVVGQLIKGKISSIRDFGAFVDIGGIEGLIPVSEIGWGRVEDIHAILEPGQEVEVAVLKLDWENDRFSFSLKQTMTDPWEENAQKLHEGDFVSGLVVRLTTFGAFVNLGEGVDGLIHISNLGGGRRINHPREVVTEGETVEVRIDSIDLSQRRVGLSLAASVKAAEEEVREQEEVRSYIKKETITETQTMGTLGDLLKQKLKGKG
ncbi:MAG: 30S ribosomal protein S1 [Proteobacteria bacterium]|nr:30S ribosomal protein S1 [Pseudomonadota bacterium]MBU1686750.1 30S ribosomal protein S1 [Pseudomonadota bacterium]